VARQLRIECEDALYPVLVRGNEKNPIFTDSDDYERFLDIFYESLALFDVQCLVLVLMRNHYHAILRILKPSLSRFMHRLNVTYSTYYNRCHEWRRTKG